MAISNYGELKTLVESYLNYGDTSVTNSIPMWIKFAHQELNRTLRTPAQEEVIYHTVLAPVLPATTGITQLPVPTNMMELKRMYYGDTFETIDLIDLEMLPQMKYDYSDISYDSRPVHIARNGDYWLLSRPAIEGNVIYITYYADVIDLVDDIDTNVFLEQAGMVLLYRSVAEGFRFLENIQMADYWMSKAVEELKIIQDHADRSENSGSVIVQANNPW